MSNQEPTLDYGEPNRRKGVPVSGVILLSVLAALVVVILAMAFM